MNYQIERNSLWLARQHRRVKVPNTVHQRTSWTDEDKQFLRDNYVDKHSLLSIATHLKRTVISVEVMMYKLRIRKREAKKPRTPKLRDWMIARLARMQELLNFCTYVSRVAPDKIYLIETAKKELKQLSGL